ncbi:MAG: hypothetical protein EOO03_02720, partial [Chitinophagaceae bacterium]
MKKLLSLSLLVMGAAQLQAQADFTALSFSDKYPKQNQKINFVYNKKYSPLIKQEGVDVVVYEFTSKGLRVEEPVLTKKGDLYSGSFTVDSNTNAVLFGFSYKDEKDNNGKNGYLVPVHDAKNKIVPGYYTAASSIHNGYGEYLTGMPNSKEKSWSVLEEGLAANPSLKKDQGFFNAYLSGIAANKKAEAATLIPAELDAYEKKGNLTESEYNFLVFMQGRQKNKEKADALAAAMKAAYPNGDWVKTEASTAFNKETDLAKKQQLFNDFVARYPETKETKQRTDFMRQQLATAYAAAKDYSNYYKVLNEMDPAMQASLNNNLSWGMAEKDENLEEAKKMSWQATSYAQKEVKSPTSPKPESMTKKGWDDGRNRSFAMYGDTYAFILYKLGDYKTGYTYAKEAAAINKLTEPEYNERYAL